MRACRRCLWFIFVVPSALAGMAEGGDGIWLDTAGNPLAETPKIVAKWGIFDAEVGAEYDSWEADFSVGAGLTIGSALCFANSRPTYANADGTYDWSRSMNWDSIGLLFTHIKRTYDFISDPEGVLQVTVTSPYQTTKQMDELLVAGPTNQRVSIGLEDLPFIPDWVDVSVGTNLCFDVNIGMGYTFNLDQDATIENLTIQPGSTLLANYGHRLELNRSLNNLGELYGTIHQIRGRVDNSGSFNGNLERVDGRVTNASAGTMVLSGRSDFRDGMVNDGHVTVATNGGVTIDKELTGTGTFVNDDGVLTLTNDDEPGKPFYLGEQIVSTGVVEAMHGFTGNTIIASSRVFGGKTYGRVVVQTGEALSFAGQVQPAGLVEASGEGTVLHIATGSSVLAPVEQQDHNAGRIEVSDGAELRTSIFPFTNDEGGRIDVTNASFILPMPYKDYLGMSSTVMNNGTVTLDGSVMRFPAESHSYHWWRKHLRGSGTLELTNHSTLYDPCIEGGGQTIIVDETSSIVVSDNPYGPSCVIEGNVVNDGTIAVDHYLTLAGTLENNGIISVNAAKTTIDVPVIQGDGSIHASSSAQLFLANSAHPGEPVLVAQPLVVENFLSCQAELRTAPGVVVEVGRQLGGQIGGHIRQLPGDFLESGTVTPTGLVESVGADKLLWWAGSNNGRINVLNGAVLKTKPYEQHNNADIDVENGGVMECRQDATGLGYGQTLWNHGRLHFDASTLRFVWRSMYNNWFTHHIEGTGRIELTNGSTLENPDIRGGQQVILDETSSLVTTFSRPRRFYLSGELETRGEVALAAGTSMELGSWNLADGSLSAPWARLYFSGNWSIGLSDPSDFRVGTLDVTFTGGDANDPLFLTAAGMDRGGDDAAWENNFALSVLTVAADGYLVLAHQDEGVSTSEALDLLRGDALYVDSLVLEPGAILNLNGSSIYYHSLSGSLDQIIDQPVPEPSCLFLLAGGSLVVLYRRRHTASRPQKS